MTGLAFVLFCLTILIQFNGFLSEHHHEIDIKATEVRRFKRNHESDKVIKSVKNNKQNKTIAKNNNIDAPVKSPAKAYVIENPRIKKQEQKQANKPIISKHFHGTLNKGKPLSADKKVDEALKVPKINDQEETPKDSAPKHTSVKSKINFNAKSKKESEHVQLKNNIVVTAKENKTNDGKSGDAQNLTIKKTNCSEEVTKENNIMEIEEHKYEEELIRDDPTGYCSQLDARHWDYFNTEFHDGLFVQENTYDYEQMGNTFKNYDPEFLYTKCVNQGSGNWFFIDLNTDHFCKTYCDCNVIKKTWLDRQIKIKVPKKENIVTNGQRCMQYNNVMKNGYNGANHALSITSSYNPYRYIKYT